MDKLLLIFAPFLFVLGLVLLGIIFHLPVAINAFFNLGIGNTEIMAIWAIYVLFLCGLGLMFTVT